MTPWWSLNLVFLIANKFSMQYWTLFSISPSCRIPLNLSKIEFTPAGDISDSTCPTSCMKSHASSTVSSVGFSNRSNKSCSPTKSLSTYWLIKWAIIFIVAWHTNFVFLLKALWNYKIFLLIIKLTISGNFVLITAIRAA